LHCLQGLVRGVNLGTEVSSSSTGSREVSCENWLEEGAEDDLSAAKKMSVCSLNSFDRSLLGEWKSEPEDKDELESVVEWEPIDGVDGTFKDSKESKDNPVLKCQISSRFFVLWSRFAHCKPLSIVGFVHAE
jgi:hypothetical protein